MLDFTRLMLISTQVEVVVEVVVEVGVELGISFTQCSPSDGSVSGKSQVNQFFVAKVVQSRN